MLRSIVQVALLKGVAGAHRFRDLPGDQRLLDQMILAQRSGQRRSGWKPAGRNPASGRAEATRVDSLCRKLRAAWVWYPRGTVPGTNPVHRPVTGFGHRK